MEFKFHLHTHTLNFMTETQLPKKACKLTKANKIKILVSLAFTITISLAIIISILVKRSKAKTTDSTANPKPYNNENSSPTNRPRTKNIELLSSLREELSTTLHPILVNASPKDKQTGLTRILKASNLNTEPEKVNTSFLIEFYNFYYTGRYSEENFDKLGKTEQIKYFCNAIFRFVNIYDEVEKIIPSILIDFYAKDDNGIIMLLIGNLTFGEILAIIYYTLGIWKNELAEIYENYFENESLCKKISKYLKDMKALTNHTFTTIEYPIKIGENDEEELRIIENYENFKKLICYTKYLIYFAVFKIDEELMVDGYVVIVKDFIDNIKTNKNTGTFKEIAIQRKHIECLKNCENIIFEIDKKIDNENVKGNKCWSQLVELAQLLSSM
eukprot:GAHX01002328.1.p1 GENE.GAHX01002328.1~~GAHX01002328.1.p1  ORF type:complete len:386 (-),score=74.49 GAHX01002328.1:46-1203(-)